MSEYLKILDEIRELHIKKSADYGMTDDPYANVRSAEAFGTPAWVGAMIRANDKMQRIKAFIANGKLENESVEDSLKDLAVYALIALVLFRQTQSQPLHNATPEPKPCSYRKLIIETLPAANDKDVDNLIAMVKANQPFSPIADYIVSIASYVVIECSARSVAYNLASALIDLHKSETKNK